MGCGASADPSCNLPDVTEAPSGLTKKSASHSSAKGPETLWYLPDGGCVVVLYDFDPSSMHWIKQWGTPLPLLTSWLVQVTHDEGNELVFGHPIEQPDKCGYFLKKYAMPLADCLNPTKSCTEQFPVGARKCTEVHDHGQCNSSTITSERHVGTLAHGIYEPLEPGSIKMANTKQPGRIPKATARAQSLWELRVGGTGTDDFRKPVSGAQSANHADKRLLDGDYEKIPRNKSLPEWSCSNTKKNDVRVKTALLAGPAGQSRIDAPTHKLPGTRITSESATVINAARDLSLDLEHDGPFEWVAQHASAAELPSDWEEFVDNDGRKAYYHPSTKRVTRQHPMLVKYAHFLKKLRVVHQRAGLHPGKIRPHLAVLLNEMLNRCNKDLPPITPVIVERIAVLLSIDTAVDHRLTSKLKLAIESYVEGQYDIAVQVHEKADVDSLLAKMQQEQVEAEVLNKPDVVIMCSEIDGLPAMVKCEQCMDYFSLEGFAKVHVAGKRKLHTPARCAQVVCSVYPHEFATCEVDGVLYCDRAYEEVAAKNHALRQRKRKILGGLYCSEYPGKKAEVLCEDCSDLFCWEAFIELHNHGNRRHHLPLQFDAEYSLQRAGETLSPEETARILSRSRMAREGGPWLAFRDDQLNSYWYHLSDKVTTSQNPYL